MIDPDAKKRSILLSTAEMVGSVISTDKNDKLQVRYDKIRKMFLKKPKKEQKVEKKMKKPITVTEQQEKTAINVFIGGFIIILTLIIVLSVIFNIIPEVILTLMIQFGYLGALISIIVLLCAIISLFVLYFATRTQDTEKEEIEF